jgi:hypothetical protein
MDKFQRLDCVKGLLMSMDNQLNDIYKRNGDLSIEKELKGVITDKYHEAILNFLNCEVENE